MKSDGLKRLSTLARFDGLVDNGSIIERIPADTQGEECNWEITRERKRHRIMTMCLRR